MRHLPRRSAAARRRLRTAREAGFTLLESLIVVVLLGLITLFGLPAFLDTIRKERLVGSARETATLMRLARAHAVKTNRRAGTTVDYAAREVIAFVDTDSSGDYTAGTDRVLGKMELPAGVGPFGPGDDIAGSVYTNACQGLPENGDAEGTVFFDGVGRATDGAGVLLGSSGAFRFTDIPGGRNFLEARVDPPATGRVSVQKYFGGDASDPNNWWEQGEDGHAWEWGS